MPDAAALAIGCAPDGGPGRLALSLGSSRARLEGMQWSLNPLGREQEPTNQMTPTPQVEDQYRYFLMVSREVGLSGTGENAELPESLLRLKGIPTGGKVDDGDSVAVESLRRTPAVGVKYLARILEVRVNGKYEDNNARLDAVKDVRDFWNQVLSVDEDDLKEPEKTKVQDAAGMIRRVSDAFPLFVE